MKKIIAGVDEVGRGSLIGPVYAAAVILKEKINIKLLKDSKLISKLNKARDGGIIISADIYPYTYWQSTMQVLFPERNFNDRESADFALSEITVPDAVIITQYDPNLDYVGKRLDEIAKIRKEHPSVTLMELISETKNNKDSETIIAKSMTEADIIEILKWDFTNICTDGDSHGGHPRGYGTYPKVLGQYVRDKHFIELENAIYKMTGLPSLNMELKDRGILGIGRAADIVVFDPLKIIDKATYQDSKSISEGIEMVIVNGRIVFTNGFTTNNRPGKFLKGPGYYED